MIAVLIVLALAQDPFFHGTYAQALARAAERKALVMVDVHSELFPGEQKELWRNPTVQERLRAKFVLVRVNMDEAPGSGLCDRYGVNIVPSQLIIDPATQEEVDRVSGCGPADFVVALDRILGGDCLAARRKRAESHPNDIEALYTYAMNLDERQKTSASQSLYTKIIQLDPDDRKGKTSLARFQLATHESNASRDLQPLIDLAAKYPETPGALEAHQQLAEARLNSSDPESRKLALASFDYLLQHGRREQNLESYAWLLAGALPTTKESLAKALAMAEEAVRVADHPWAHSTVAQCLFLSGRTEEALARARHAVESSVGIEKEWCQVVLARLLEDSRRRQ